MKKVNYKSSIRLMILSNIKTGFFVGIVLFTFFSCITTRKVREIDGFRIEAENDFNEESFVFKPKMLPGQARRSLRKKFDLTDEQKLANFNAKLFDDLNLMFNVKISFEVDREETSYYTPLLYGEAPEDMVGKAETFVKIIITDPEGNNCLSQRSLFYNKTKSFLLKISNTIESQEFYIDPIHK